MDRLENFCLGMAAMHYTFLSFSKNFRWWTTSVYTISCFYSSQSLYKNFHWWNISSHSMAAHHGLCF